MTVVWRQIGAGVRSDPEHCTRRKYLCSKEGPSQRRADQGSTVTYYIGEYPDGLEVSVTGV